MTSASLYHRLLLFLIFCSSVSTCGTLVDAADKVEKKYNKVKTKVVEKYDNFTSKFHPQPKRYLDSFMGTHNALPTSFFSNENMYPVSLDWSVIEPQEGSFDITALNQYAALCNDLVSQNITPLIILFHSSAPQWFIDKKGFSAYENIPYFVRYAQKVAAHLNKHHAYWITLVNPNSYAAQMHINDLKSILNTLHHMITAHRDIYNSIKTSVSIHRSLIGIAFNTDPVLPWHKFNPSHQFKATMLNRSLQASWSSLLNTGTMETGLFGNAHDGFMHSISQAFDFIGITHNGPQYIDKDYPLLPSQQSSQNADAPITRNLAGLRIDPTLHGRYPEGLYESIKSVSQRLNKKVPLLVLQDEQQIPKSAFSTYYQHNLAAILKAHQEGCKVIGYVVCDHGSRHSVPHYARE